MTLASLYKLALLVLFPIFVAVHGIVWIVSTNSLAFSVYAMKLVFMPFLIAGIVLTAFQISAERRKVVYALAITPLFALSMLSPFITGKGVNFYYIADTIGLAITIVSIFVVFALLKRGALTLYVIEQTSAYYLAIISAYIVVYYFVSGGMKISITPEMQIPMAIMFGAAFFPISNGYRTPAWIFVLVAIGCYLSLLRESVAVFALLAAVCAIRRFCARNWLRIFVGGAACLLVVLLFAGYVSDLPDIFQFTNDLGQDRALYDESVMQRFVEIEMVFAEMQKVPLSFILGQGFGATYENVDGGLVHYGDQVHNVHSTPAAIYLRHGLYGVFLYFSVFVYACLTIFSADKLVFRASLVVVIMYATLFFNQYLYWNVQFGLALALWFYSLSAKNSGS